MTTPQSLSIPLYELLGFRLVTQEKGRVIFEAEVRDDLRNRRGVMHGGVVSALLDSALGGAVVAGIASEEWCATVQMSVQFLSGARSGPLRAEGKMLQRGKRCAFASGAVRDAEGTLVAEAHGTWYIWPGKPSS